MYASKELRDYASKADDTDKVFDAWHLLLEEKSLEKTNAKVLKEVEDNYQAIKNAGGYSKWKNVTGAGNWLSTFKNKLVTRVQGSTGFALKHTDAEITQIINKGKSLNLTDDIIDDMLFISCRDAKRIDAVELMQQMDNYVNVVLKNGHPYTFNSLENFTEFSSKLKKQLSDYGIISNDIKIQGSALRTPNAKDIDVAIFMNENDFAVLTNKMKDAIRKRSPWLAGDNLIKNLETEISKGKVNAFYFDRIEPYTSFMNDFYEARKVLGSSTATTADVSIIIKGKGFDIKPYLDLK
ncbi:hypothetical protein [Flavobacterium davisii]|uniref:Uncharacterized protein n=1 Tax=Flavobacterium columnare TaxID=996 RepID=A0A8G0PAH2_9FLAO|nr:hypothetical protein [Flavobacterium davisii]QYS89478.1 hypothetical protein JJC05_04150 [Flavobacterium davisii]